MIKKFLSIYVAGFGTGIIGSILANVIKEQTYFYYKLMLVATLVIVFCLSLKLGLLRNNKNTQDKKYNTSSSPSQTMPNKTTEQSYNCTDDCKYNAKPTFIHIPSFEGEVYITSKTHATRSKENRGEK